MFILSLTYLKGNDEADKHMEPHMAWVKEGYAKGWFLASGRKVPRTGGVIFAHGDKSELEAYVAADPFTIHGVAAYDVQEITLTTIVDGLERLKAE
ncbi:GTP cyclohydrolase [Rhizobium sp. P38BS-XIX]|uniref:YciI family protein n=1 Tax=Rhizobium sp. P38BS-XIX TaxID=2726740 RepID=UPI00145639FD|nr:YciI family protein [Rhizobium sp. P38BS-XIX]NLR99632.1 GTP cyclohydrolase [Rhizobium sp. P38BS-XIX]